MPEFVLTVLKVVFLVLLYFFVYRAMRAVVLDLRGRESARSEARTPTPSRSRQARGKLPRSLVLLDERGGKLDTVSLNGTLQIGRADACQVRVDDNYASTFHARIFSREGSWFVEDMGSTNGTYLNDRRIESPAELRVGDTIRIGKTSLELRR